MIASPSKNKELPSPLLTLFHSSISGGKSRYWAALILIVMCILWSKQSSITIGSETTRKTQQEQINERIHMYKDLIYNNRHPDDTALQLLETTNKAELSYTATAISQMEGPPFSDMVFSKLANVCGKNKRCNCGVHKCFFSHASNPGLGFLVSSGNTHYKKMMAAYKREEYLIDTFGIVPISVGAPRKYYNVTDPMLKTLEIFGKDGYTPLVVQKVYKAPEPSLFVGAGSHKSHRTIEAIPRFAQQLVDGSSSNTEKALQAFSDKFQEEISRLYKVVSDPNNVYLRHDWQCIISHTGELFYIDLDRGLKDLDDYAKLKPKRIKQGMEEIGRWLTTGLASNFSGLEKVELFVYD